MKKIGKNKILAVIFWIFAVAVAVVIFRFSCDTGEESAEVSESLLSVIIEFIGRFISHNTLRKIAHFSEFALLGVTLMLHISALRQRFTIKCGWLWAWGISTLYAGSDEFHQGFVGGRAPSLSDVGIDSCGAIAGVLLVLLCRHLQLNLLHQQRQFLLYLGLE